MEKRKGARILCFYAALELGRTIVGAYLPQILRIAK